MIYTPPSWFTVGSPKDSGWMRAPIPHPGNVGEYIQKAVVALDGRNFVPQFKYLGSYTYPTRNICGYLTYQQLDANLRMPESEVVVNDYGVLVFASNSPLEDVQKWSTTCDYTFVDEEVEPPTIPVTYKPVVQFVRNDDGPVGFPVGGYGMSETVRDYPYYYLSKGARVRVSGGSARLSNPLTQAVLRARIGTWKALPSRARRRTMESGYYGYDFSATESEEGYYTAIVAGFWWLNMDISEDITDSEENVIERGWTGDDVAVKVKEVARQNSPVIIDSKHLSISPRTQLNDIYNTGKAETILTGLITSRKWLDGQGTYDTEGLTAFSGIGWTAAGPADWPLFLGGFPAKAHGGKSMLRFLTADGGRYRVRLKVIVWVEYVLTVISTPQAELSLGSPGDIEIEMPESGDWAFHAIEVDEVWRHDGGEWVVIDSAGVISGNPGAGVKILSALIARRGRRWGFVEHVEGGEWPEDLDGGINQSESARFYRKRIFRLRRSAVSSK